MLTLSLHQRAETLRAELRQWLQSNPPPVLPERVELEEFVNVSRAWQRKLAAERWIAVHWPESYGGRGLGLLEEAVVQECLAEAGSPQLVNLFGLTMVGPVLIQHGTPEQKERYLPRILTAEEIWCQGFSEPEAGSDLASLKTVAVRNDTGWSIRGQKIWTSFAQYAEWCFLLARTDASVPKHKGLTYLLVPMTSEGIEVRPLMQISGDREFNELFFDDTHTDEKNIVGAPGDGWKIAISTLMYERVILTFARHLQSQAVLSEIRDLLRTLPEDSRSRAEFGRLSARHSALRALALSHLAQYEQRAPGPEGSYDKLAWSETFQEICQLALELQSRPGASAEQRIGAEFRYLYSRGRTIAAGTSEIQKNIIAERVLGLSRDR
ncbi:MAG: acyl-CoA dehydrogenase family protein [Bdellovibrionales bacterium]|nr:acyl-CoA dehydrogenase family protein [Bdellovibrionales bacterium]